MRITISRFIGLALMSALAILSLPFGGNAQTLPDGAGKEAVQQNCTRCHLLRSVVAARHTRQEWDNVVTDMVGRGAAIMENEMTAIVDYLARTFPKDTSNVNVNRATSKELVDALRLTAQEADAVVRYREENGYFSKFQELESVAGLDV